MANKLTMIISLGVFVLLIAFALPSVITAVNGGSTQEIVLQATGEDQTLTVTAGLTVTADSIGQNEATITLRDTQTGQEANATIAEGDTVDMVVRNETITVTNEQSGNDEVELMITYPRTYGWGDGGKAFLDQFELIISATAILVIVGVMRGIFKS